MLTQNHKLSEEETLMFKKYGYVLYNKPVFPDEKFTALKKYFEMLLDRLGKGDRPEAMDRPHLRDTKLYDWLFADEVLDLVEPILGPDIVLYSSHFICKPAGDGRRVPWHEDSSYWGNRLDPMEVVTVWLAIDPSTEENGCMKIVPGTHKNGYSEYEKIEGEEAVFSTEITGNEEFDKKAVSLILKPNEASLHDGRIIHGSEANNSNIRRCGYTMRYISAKTKLNDPGYQLFLARGRDLGIAKYADPSKTYKIGNKAKTAFDKK